MQTSGPARRRKKGQTDEHDDDDHFEPAQLPVESDSVEPVDEDEDFVPYLSTPPIVRTYAKRTTSDKGKEEADKNDEQATQQRQSKRLRRRSQSESFLVHPEEIEDILVEGSEEDDGPQQDEPRTETVTVDQIAQTATVNIAYLNALVGAAAYFQKSGRPNVERSIREVEADIESTLHALRDCPLPITQAGPIEHAVPPTIPMADGTEVRFTNVAQSLGIIWRDVPEEKKQVVYNRALDLHHEVFGCAPIRKLMYTSAGRRGVHYYNESTYRPTMFKALLEFKKREMNGSASLSPQ